MQTRRDFLKVGLGGLGAVSLGGTMPAFMSRFARGAAAPAASAGLSNDNILVVVQLSGGNDGLNTVIPLGDDAYHNARPTLGIHRGAHRLTDRYALNPAMRPFKALFDDGKLAIVNGCGYPNPNRSHYKSMEIWHTASAQGPQRNGWLGHYVDHVLRGTDGLLKAVNIGPELPQALVADDRDAPSIQSIDDFAIRTASAGLDASAREQILGQLSAAAEASPAIKYLSRQSTNAMIDADAIRRVVAGYRPDAVYPDGLGQNLRLIAQLITGQLGTRLFYCQAGGFDTHANQGAQHGRLLGGVAASIGAFYTDLAAKGFGDKVTVMCFSEFGRRVAENSSGGTDHGAAGPMFVIGGKVRGGIYGEHPSLTDLDDGDLKHTTDFRRVYATLLDGWLNCDSAAILKNRFESIPFL